MAQLEPIQNVLDSEDDDISEVCVTGNDGRRRIDDSPRKRDSIVECIGQLRINYYHRNLVGQRNSRGTGTIFHVEGNRCFVITAAHNSMTKIHKCNTQNCPDQDKLRLVNAPKGTCRSCDLVKIDNNGVLLRLLKAHGIEFTQRSIATNSFGRFVNGFPCSSIAQNVIVPTEYETWSHPKSGYDICILSFENQQAADFYRIHCQHIYLVNNIALFNNDTHEMHLYGYPIDKRDVNNGKAEMWGMSTSNGNDFYVSVNNTPRNNQPFIINKEIDTQPAQSGSSIYCLNRNEENKHDEYWICAIHTGGSARKRENYATLLDDNKIQWIQEYFADIGIDITDKIKNVPVNIAYQCDTNKVCVNANVNVFTAIDRSNMFVSNWIDNGNEQKISRLKLTINEQKLSDICFGIASDDTLKNRSLVYYDNSYVITTNNKKSALTSNDDGFLKNLDFSCSELDTITLSLYRSKLTIKKEKCDEKEIVLFDEIPINTDKKYKFGITLYKGQQYRIIELSQNDIKVDEHEINVDNETNTIQMNNDISCTFKSSKIQINRMNNIITSISFMNLTYIGGWINSNGENAQSLKIQIIQINGKEIGIGIASTDTFLRRDIQTKSYFYNTSGYKIKNGESDGVKPVECEAKKNDIIVLTLCSSTLSIQKNNEETIVLYDDIQHTQYKFVLNLQAKNDQCQILDIT